ncbi:IclR family transcriptional regulator [Cobetia sp. 29-18-1]|uniref:IclR family transcriptional regulator n=1 Tax=Cobetia sp. 29-18-1 TaxID=3040018 RepID=UPI002447715B|nr:IclR family transcriptional regulator [Cobetia sp. 29-18-1]MDH2299366.1 IclR family transcriptional regulator [Cobetia sp. 29-18-1]
MSTREGSGVQVVARVAAILKSLEGSEQGMSLGEIAASNDLPRSTVKRLVDALAQEDLLEIHGHGGIRLGSALMRLARHSQLDITTHAKSFLEALSGTTEETVVLCSLSGNELLILHSVLSPLPLRVSPMAGNFLSLHATASGKVLLSHLEDEQVERLLGTDLTAYTDNTLAMPALLTQLAEVRRTGIGHDEDEHMQGVGAIGIGLETSQGHYSVSVVGPSWRISERRAEIQAALQATRDEMLKAFRSLK